MEQLAKAFFPFWVKSPLFCDASSCDGAEDDANGATEEGGGACVGTRESRCPTRERRSARRAMGAPAAPSR